MYRLTPSLEYEESEDLVNNYFASTIIHRSDTLTLNSLSHRHTRTYIYMQEYKHTHTHFHLN